MTEIHILYQGDLSTRCVQLGNYSEVLTDAPKDNGGLERFFSPTDLFAASVGSCMLTLMGIVAKRLNLDLTGMWVKVNKEMVTSPVRRIGRLKMEVFCPQQFGLDLIAKLIHAAETCPVHQSLHPDLILQISYKWGND